MGDTFEVGRIRENIQDTLTTDCNTGYSNTICGIEASIDYITVTFPPSEHALETAKAVFGGGGSWRSRGMAGRYYSQSLQNGALTLYYGGNGGGVTVEARGEGCRQIERAREISKEEGWQNFLRELSDAGATIARLDFAFDEKDGVLSVPEIEENVRAGWCATRFRIASPVDWVKPKTGSIVGKAVMFGGRASKVCVRIYDKGLEQLQVSKNISAWVRVEIETKDKKADEFAARFVEEGFQVILSDLRARITFREPQGTDTNKSRWPICGWWERFLSKAPRALIASPMRQATLEEKAQQIERQWGPTLVAISTAPHLGDSWLDGVTSRNQARLQERHIEALVASCQLHQAQQDQLLVSRV